MRIQPGVLLVGVGLLFSAAGLAAHHSAAADYDESKTVAFTGTVSKIEWTNPHARFVIDVVNPDKTVASWSFELASPNSLTRGGWGKRTLTAGDVVTVTGSPARSGKTLGVTKSVTAADGKKLFTGTMGIEP
ncbi:MAG: hypothetical protein EXQ48_02335 [Acidobacteria bacterium]|nr:hypothetical protein [Acidobacteriota bacterium]